MAAGVLESVAIPRPSSGVQRVSPSPRAALVTSVSPVSNAQGVGSLPVFNGLRIGGRPVKAASADRRSRAVRKGVVCEVQETATDVPDVTTATWQSSVLESDIPVLVDFWAVWCGPCRMIFPVLSELSKEYAGKLKCLKLDTDENPEIASKYGIRSIPTIMIFKNGEKKDALIGAVPKSTLTAFVEKFL